MNTSPSRKLQINWVQLGLELIVVVVGILLALFIDSWIEDRRNAELEEAFLRQLHLDLTRAEEQMSVQLTQTEEAEAFTLQLLDASRNKLEVDNDTIAYWLVRAFYWSDPVPTASIAQALADSEHLYILGSLSLRSEVTKMIDHIRQLESRLLPLEQRILDASFILNRWAPPQERGLPLSIGMISEYADALRSDLSGPVSLDLNPIVMQPEVQSALTQLFWAHENLHWYQEQMIDATTDLRIAVEAELPL